MLSIMYCQKCGHAIDNESNYCPNCGSNQSEQNPKHSYNKKSKKVLVFFSLVIIIIGIITGIYLHKQNEYTAKLSSDDLLFIYDDSDALEIKNTIISKYSAKDVKIEITYYGNKGLFDSYSETHNLGDLESNKEIIVLKSISSLGQNLRGEFEYASIRVLSGYKQEKYRGIKSENNTECSFNFTYNPNTRALTMTIENNTHKNITELRSFQTTINFSNGGKLDYYTSRIVLPEALSPGAKTTITTTDGNKSWTNLKTTVSSNNYTKISYQVIYK